MKPLFLTHKRYMPVLIGMLIPIAFGLGWLSMLLVIPFVIMLAGIYLSRQFLKGQLQSVAISGFRLLLLVAYSIICRLYIFDIYQVNSSSMEGTLIKGDVLLVNKLAYGPLEIKNTGEISWVKLFRRGTQQDNAYTSVSRKNGYTNIKQHDVFVYELFPGYFVVKRCVGLPGESIKISNDTAYVNNQFVSFPQHDLSQYRIKFSDRNGLKSFSSSIPHSVIDSVNIDSNVIIANLSQRELPGAALRIDRLLNKLLPGKTPYFRPDIWTINNLGPLTIPYKGWAVVNPSIYNSTIEHWESGHIATEYVFKENYYFMMGDNKPYSEDSRYLGLIPEKKIVGKVAFILYSYNEKGFVWNRLFKNIL
jgi:signal peptidase I